MAVTAPKRSKVDRKARLIDAALQLFQSHGVAGLRLVDIAKKAKVPPPLIHYYFKDLSELHFEVVQVILNELIESSVASFNQHMGDPVARLKEYMRAPMIWANKNPSKLSVWLYFYHMSSCADSFRTLNSDIRARGRERISLLLYEGLEQGVFQLSSISVQDTALYIQTLITGNVIMLFTEKKFKDMNSWLDLQEHVVFSMLAVSNTNKDKRM